MEDLTILAQEIDRVITTPYLPSLKPLYDIVDRSPLRVLQEWALFKPCQIYSLAGALREGLFLWPFCIDLLKRWTEVVSVRDAVLEQEPLLLDQLLAQTHSIQKEANSLAIQNTCITLLSNPIPDHIALPNAAQYVIQDAVDTVAHKPSTASLRSVYRLFKGTKTILLDVVPNDILNNFMQQCRRILKSSEDHIRPLLCLAIFAQIASGSTESLLSSAESIGGPELLPRTKDFRQEAADIFNKTFSSKILDLVVLRAIHACSEGKNITHTEAIEHLQLGKQILKSIDQVRRAEWAETNVSRVHKLCVKIVRPGIELEVQLVALCLCSTLLSIEKVPRNIVEVSKSILFSRLEVRLEWLDETSFASLVNWISFVPFDQEGTPGKITKQRKFDPTEFVLNAMDTCRPGQRETTELYLQLSHSLKVAESLAMSSTTSPDLCRVLSSRMILERIPEWWDLNLPLEKNAQGMYCDCGRSVICPFAFEDLRTQAASQLSSLILQACCMARFEVIELLPPTKHFVKLISCLAETKAKAALSLSQRKQSRLDICRQNSVKHKVGHEEKEVGDSVQWRETLENEMMKFAYLSSDKVKHLVGSVCRDLEVRCETIEGPLREAEARYDELANELQTLQQKSVETQKNLEQTSADLQSASIKNTRLASEVDDLSLKYADSSKEVVRLQTQIVSEQSRAHVKILAAEQEAALAEMDGKASIAVLEEKLSSDDAKIGEINDEKAALKKTLEGVQNEREQLQEEAQRTMKAHEERISGVMAQNDLASVKYEKRIGEIEAQLKEAKQELRDYEKGWADNEQTFQTELDCSRNREAETRALFEAQIKQMQSSYEEKIQSMEVVIDSARRHAELDLQSCNNEIRSLESKLANVTKKRKAQAQELKAEREFKRGILSFIGPERKISETSKAVAGLRATHQHPDEVIDLFSDTAKSRENLTTQQLERSSSRETESSPPKESSPYPSHVHAVEVSEVERAPRRDGPISSTSPSTYSHQAKARSPLGEADMNVASMSMPPREARFSKASRGSCFHDLAHEQDKTPHRRESWLAEHSFTQSVSSDGLMEGDETAEL